MKIITLLTLLLSFNAVHAASYELESIFNQMEKRFSIKLMYANDVLTDGNGEKVSVNFDASTYRQDELFGLLKQSLGVAFQTVENRPKQFVVRSRKTQLEERLIAIERRLSGIKSAQSALQGDMNKNYRAIQAVHHLIDEHTVKD